LKLIIHYDKISFIYGHMSIIFLIIILIIRIIVNKLLLFFFSLIINFFILFIINFINYYNVKINCIYVHILIFYFKSIFN